MITAYITHALFVSISPSFFIQKNYSLHLLSTLRFRHLLISHFQQGHTASPLILGFLVWNVPTSESWKTLRGINLIIILTVAVSTHIRCIHMIGMHTPTGKTMIWFLFLSKSSKIPKFEPKHHWDRLCEMFMVPVPPPRPPLSHSSLKMLRNSATTTIWEW